MKSRTWCSLHKRALILANIYSLLMFERGAPDFPFCPNTYINANTWHSAGRKSSVVITIRNLCFLDQSYLRDSSRLNHSPFLHRNTSSSALCPNPWSPTSCTLLSPICSTLLVLSLFRSLPPPPTSSRFSLLKFSFLSALSSSPFRIAPHCHGFV